jgi:hypothetical protein
MARVGLHVGEDWWTFLSTYDDHGPILDIAAGSTTVTFCFDGQRVTAAAVEFARELADKAAKFAAEAERLHAVNHSEGPDCRACQERRDGEAA